MTPGFALRCKPSTSRLKKAGWASERVMMVEARSILSSLRSDEISFGSAVGKCVSAHGSSMLSNEVPEDLVKHASSRSMEDLAKRASSTREGSSWSLLCDLSELYMLDKRL